MGNNNISVVVEKAFNKVLPIPKVKTTITVDKDLWNRFSVIVIEREGLRKKNEVIERLVKQYIEEKGKCQK